MKLFNLFIVIIIASFFTACSNDKHQPCQLPDLYLQGEESSIIDSTDNWVLKTKKVVRYNSSCDSDSVSVNYYVKKGTSTKRIPYTAQGKKADIDSLLAAQNCGVVVGPAIDNGGGNNNSGFFSWLSGLFSGLPEFIGFIFSLIGFLILLLFLLWLLKNLFELLFSRSSIRKETISKHSETETNEEKILKEIETGKPATTKTVMPDGSIIIPAALGKLKKEEIKIHITREYYEDGTEKQ